MVDELRFDLLADAISGESTDDIVASVEEMIEEIAQVLHQVTKHRSKSCADSLWTSVLYLGDWTILFWGMETISRPRHNRGNPPQYTPSFGSYPQRYLNRRGWNGHLG